VHPGDLAQGCSDLEMTWLLCCAGAATAFDQNCYSTAESSASQLHTCCPGSSVLCWKLLFWPDSDMHSTQT